jgi:hypothetical protein
MRLASVQIVAATGLAKEDGMEFQLGLQLHFGSRYPIVCGEAIHL